MRHEFERRRLLLVQQMEAELLDANELVELPMPADNNLSTLFSVVGNTGPVTINLGPAAISTNSRVAVENVLSGGIKYTEEDREILSLLAKVNDDVAALQLRSDLDRLKDPSTSPDEKCTSVQKLKGFLYTMGKKAGYISTEVLISYLNSILTGHHL